MLELILNLRKRKYQFNLIVEENNNLICSEKDTIKVNMIPKRHCPVRSQNPNTMINDWRIKVSNIQREMAK